MNIFVLDEDPKIAAEYHCDQHVNKQILESAQMLSTAHHMLGEPVRYKMTHQNHPCSVWVRQSQQNYNWLVELAFWLNYSFVERYGKVDNHASWDYIRNELPTPDFLPSTPTITPFALAMDDEFKVGGTVDSYRNYYIKAKNTFKDGSKIRWTLPATQPSWYT
jgi:hypothetical protein